jgi:hypothetical protein
MPVVRPEALCSMDSSVSPNAWRTGEQRLERPLRMHLLSSAFVFNQFGDLERCTLRPGNVHGADGWESVLKPVVARYQGKVSRIYFRADAGFANPEVYKYPEAKGIKYAIRLPAIGLRPVCSKRGCSPTYRAHQRRLELETARRMRWPGTTADHAAQRGSDERLQRRGFDA